MRTGLAIPGTLSSIKPLSLNRVDAAHNDYTQLLGQFLAYSSYNEGRASKTRYYT